MNAPGPERAAEARRAAGRQHVVGARGVVAERRRAARARRRRSRRPARAAIASSAPSKASSRCSGASASASASALEDPGREDQRQRRVGDARPLGGERRRRARRAGRAAPASVEIDDQRAVGAVLGLGAEVEREPVGVRAVESATIASSLGPGEPVDADDAGDLALRLGDVAVARAGDHVDGARSSRSRRRARRSPGRRRARRPRRPPAIAQAARTTRVGAAVGVRAARRRPRAATPAIRAGSAPISTDEGYDGAPAGRVDRPRPRPALARTSIRWPCVELDRRSASSAASSSALGDRG